MEYNDLEYNDLLHRAINVTRKAYQNGDSASWFIAADTWYEINLDECGDLCTFIGYAKRHAIVRVEFDHTRVRGVPKNTSYPNFDGLTYEQPICIVYYRNKFTGRDGTHEIIRISPVTRDILSISVKH